MIDAPAIAIIAAGLFFLNGLVTGVWKYLGIQKSETGQAHIYVDIAHRTSLLYSFAALLLSRFLEISRLSATVETVAVLVLVGYFAAAILSYMVRGFKKDTENQLHPAGISVRVFMWTLIVGEIGAFVVIFYGVLVALL
jgi:hypothetical protein